MDFPSCQNIVDLLRSWSKTVVLNIVDCLLRGGLLSANSMVGTLIENYGYNEDSAEEVIKFAANNLWRDS